MSDAPQDKVAKLPSIGFIDLMELIHIAGDNIERDSPVLLVESLHVTNKIINMEQPGQLVPLGMADQVTVFGKLNAFADPGFYDFNIRIRLGDEIHRPDLQTVQLSFVIHRKNNDRNRHEILIHLHRGHDLTPAHVGHIQIKQKKRDIILVQPQHLHGFNAVRRVIDIVIVLKQFSQDFPVHLHIIGDQDVPAHADGRHIIQFTLQGRPFCFAFSRHRPQAFQQLFLPVHGCVSPLKGILDAVVLIPEIIRHAPGNHRFIRPYVFMGKPVEPMHKFMPVFIVPSCQKNHKFISADAVHRAVGEYPADHGACLADILISGRMPLGIIDLLQSIDITDNDCKFSKCSLCELIIPFLFRFQVSMLAFHSGQAILVCPYMDLGDLGAQLSLHGLDPPFQIIHGCCIVTAVWRRHTLAFRFRTAAHFLHQGAGQLIELPMDQAQPSFISRDNGGHDPAPNQKRKDRHNDRRPGEGGQLPVIPFSAKVYGDNASHLAPGVKNRAVRTVEFPPGVLIVFIIRRGSSLARLIKRVCIHDRGTEFTRILHRGIQPKREGSVPHVPDTIDILQINIVLEVCQRPHDGFIPIRPLISGRDIFQDITVNHRRGGIGNIQHSCLHQRDDGDPRLPHQKVPQRSCDNEQKDKHQDQVLRAVSCMSRSASISHGIPPAFSCLSFHSAAQNKIVTGHPRQRTVL